MKIKTDINENIFRGYDIRGKYPNELDDDTAYTIGLGFASYIKSLGKTTCVVGYDNRLSSPALHTALVTGLVEAGLDVICLGECTLKACCRNAVALFKIAPPRQRGRLWHSAESKIACQIVNPLTKN